MIAIFLGAHMMISMLVFILTTKAAEYDRYNNTNMLEAAILAAVPGVNIGLAILSLVLITRRHLRKKRHFK